KKKYAAVDPNSGFLTRTQPLPGALLDKFEKMETDRRMNGDKTTDLTALLETINHVRQWRVGQAVAIVCQKDLFVLNQMPDRHEPLSNVAPGSGVYKRHAPVRWPFTQNLDLFAELRDHAVAICRLP